MGYEDYGSKGDKFTIEKDVLKMLRKSCDKYDIKLGLYYWKLSGIGRGARRGKGGRGNYDAGGINPEVKKAQLKELLTQYGPIELIWFDHALVMVVYRMKKQPVGFINFNQIVL